MPLQKLVPFFLCLLLFTSQVNCGVKSQEEQSIQEYSPPDSLIPYTHYLDSLNLRKTGVDTADYSAARGLLYNVVNNEIPAYWIGTTWDFNGVTQTPNEGYIACGYFLTTVMKQTGYDIKRVWMAQQASSVLINAYCTDIIKTNSLDKVRDYLSEQPDSSTFIIGLDFHTGFVTKLGSDYYLIHSNYINSEGVIKEKVETADVLTSNSFFMIGSLNKRKNRVGQWMGW